MVCQTSLFNHRFCQVNAALVVGCNEDYAVFLYVCDSVGNTVIIASMRLLNTIPHRRISHILFSDLSFFVHVCASDKFESKIIPKLLRSFNLILNNLLNPLEIALVPIHYNMAVSNIIFVRHLLAEGFDCGLHKSLFCIYIQHTIPFVAQVTDDV